jgi:hypothetical protein
MVDHRSLTHRISGRQPRLALWVALALLVLLGGPAAWGQTTPLKDIRIGEYAAFIRVVFEFDQAVRHAEPVDKGDGKLAITFRDATADLQKRASQYANRRIEAIVLVQQGNDLTANIALPISEFRLKTFTLTSPDRVVLDIYQAAPPETRPAPSARIIILDLQIKDSLAPPPPAVPTDQPQPAAAEPAPEAIATPTQAPATAETSPAVQPTVSPEAQPEPEATVAEALPQAPDEAPEEVVTPLPQTETDTPPSTAAQASPPAITAETPETRPSAPTSTPTTAPQTATAVSSAAPSTETVTPPSGDGQLQRYLTIALIIIGTIIVFFVCFILIQKRRTAQAVKSEKGVELLKNTDEIIAAIDAKIKEKLKAYE